MQIFANGNSIFIFHGILCDTPKKSRGKNLIMVTTLKFWVLVLNYKFPNKSNKICLGCVFVAL